MATDCGMWVEGTMDTDEGATRDFYNRGARLPWRNYLGDWHDRDDTPQGDAHFAVATVEDDGETGYIEWDVTDLVQAWVDETVTAKGFFLRPVGGGGTFNFYSKEHPTEAERPELVVVTTDGSDTLAPEADTYLEDSTYQGFGDDVQLSITDQRPMLLRFDLSAYPTDTTVQSATLRLYKYEDYGGGSMDVGVFRCSQGMAARRTATRTGSTSATTATCLRRSTRRSASRRTFATTSTTAGTRSRRRR